MSMYNVTVTHHLTARYPLPGDVVNQSFSSEIRGLYMYLDRKKFARKKFEN